MADLCERCVKIPRPIHFRRSRGFPSRSIGTKAQIQVRKDRCPFCRLIYNAIFDNPIPYRVADESRLGVIWNGEYYYFSAGHGEDLGIKIAVIQEEDTALSPANYARPLTGHQVDLGRVQTWLDLCREHHQQGSALQQIMLDVVEDPGSQPHDPLRAMQARQLPARVIDTQEACVVPLTPDTGSDTRYVTLSYVWGQAAQYKLLSSNKNELMNNPGFLSSIRGQLPRTIRDAMDVVRSLGLRYLWVDALCIIQDDGNDRDKEIYRMDAIYEGSVFTLVAASGTHADAGLAALHARQGDHDGQSEYVETIWPGVRMTALHDLQDILSSVKYGTRGWTFQEQVLSSRILVFTDRMIYFHCHDCTWSEDSRADETPRQRTEIGGPRAAVDRVELAQNSWVLYCTYLEQYSLRELTNEGDRVSAMMGILQRIRRKLQCRLVHGLLGHAFEWSLLFDVKSCQRIPLFPSYSWAGWKGGVWSEWPNALDFEPGDWDELGDASESLGSYGGSESAEVLDPKDGLAGDDDDWEDEEDDGNDDDNEHDDDDNGDGDNGDTGGDPDLSSSSSSESEYDYHNSDSGSDGGDNEDDDLDSASDSTAFTEKANENAAKSTWIVWYERPAQGEPELIAERDNLEERQTYIQVLKTTLFTNRANMKHTNLRPTEPTLHLGYDLQTQLPREYSVLQFWTVSVKLRLATFGVASAHRANVLDRQGNWCGQLRLPEDLEPQSGSTVQLILLSVTRYHHIMIENPKMFNGVSPLAVKESGLPEFYRVMWIHRLGEEGNLSGRVAVGEIHHSALRRPVEGRAEWKEIILA